MKYSVVFKDASIQKITDEKTRKSLQFYPTDLNYFTAKLIPFSFIFNEEKQNRE